MEDVKFIDRETDPDRYTNDDMGMSNWLADSFKHCLRYVRDVGKWYYYDGCVLSLLNIKGAR